MRKESNLHYIGKFEEAAFRLPPGYESYSQGYFRVALIDHTAGSVHMGLGICQLEQGGTLAPHIQAYREAWDDDEARLPRGHQVTGSNFPVLTS